MRFLSFVLLLLVSAVLLPFGLQPAYAFSDAARPEAMIGFFAQPRVLGRGAVIRVVQWPADETGRVMRASWYGGGEPLSRYTASGAPFRPWALTAAHRTLPFGTRLRVSHGGRSAIVVVNDRGPAAWTGRSLDLSRGAARAIGIERAGAAPVRVSRLP
ncbi:MAG: septal ring lytic transglycosylase RlpA family protein [Rhodoblastus sp.]